MSGLKSGLVTVVVAGALGVFTVVGCTASGDADAVDDTTPVEPAESGSTLPSGSSGNNGVEDAGKADAKKDATTKDSAPPDAGPPPPVAGTACTTVDEIRNKSCGVCGTQSTICLDDGTGKKWQTYSPCGQELAGGCLPGTVIDEPCGNCGTQKKTCTQYCAFTTAACTGQPANSCVPGSVDLQNASCATFDVFHQRTCSATCTTGSFSAACTPPPTVVEVGPTPGSISSTIAIITNGQTLPRVSGTSCPAATFLATTITPYVYLQVHNPLAKSATVAIYNSLAPGGAVVKTVMAAYDGAVAPTDEATRKVCLKASTFGTVALTGDSKFASMDGTKAITIAPGATVSVYVGAYTAYDATKPAETTGAVKLNVATVSVQ